MKKVMALFLGLAFIGLQAVAQTKTLPAVKQEVKKEVSKTGAAVKQDAKTKADGSLDMRYKENKQAAGNAAKSAVVNGPKKADGTPDMRYKDNKAPAKSK